MDEMTSQIFTSRNAAGTRAQVLVREGMKAAITGPVTLINHFGPDNTATTLRAPAGTQWWIVVGSTAEIATNDG
jgi:hypothetical protein